MYQSVLQPTLYTPASKNKKTILALANRVRPNGIWRMVLDTEDAILEEEVPDALERIRAVLAELRADSPVCLYVRVRNSQVLAQVLDMPHVTKLTGFVIPKADPSTFPKYVDQLHGTDFRVMPILEAPLMFDRHFRETLRAVLMHDRYHGMIDCLRIGANDLLGHLGIRRASQDFIIYDTPVGNLIMDIIGEYKGVGGFTITAPVFELYDEYKHAELFRREARQNINNGLFGQTVISLSHLLPLRNLYSVTPEDLESATQILARAKAVNGLHGRMDEFSTHWKWAEQIVERHNVFGRTDKFTRENLLLEALTTPEPDHEAA